MKKIGQGNAFELELSICEMAENLPKSTYVNIMAQYHVDFKAFEYPEIWRSIMVISAILSEESKR